MPQIVSGGALEILNWFASVGFSDGKAAKRHFKTCMVQYCTSYKLMIDIYI